MKPPVFVNPMPVVSPDASRSGAQALPAVALVGAGVCLGGHWALNQIELRIHPGERVALVGANGSGKSTLLRVLHGLLPLSAGQRTAHPTLTQAMVFQRPHMLRTSAQTNVAIALWLRGLPWAQARERAVQVLAKVGLSDLALRPAKALSGGQQQRLALARACGLQPDVLFLDEPTASLDPHAKRDVEALIAELGRHMTLVFASHNLGQVKRLATRVVYLEHGRVLADLPVADFFGGVVLPHRFPEAHLFVQ